MIPKALLAANGDKDKTCCGLSSERAVALQLARPNYLADAQEDRLYTYSSHTKLISDNLDSR